MPWNEFRHKLKVLVTFIWASERLVYAQKHQPKKSYKMSFEQQKYILIRAAVSDSFSHWLYTDYSQILG